MKKKKITAKCMKKNSKTTMHFGAFKPKYIPKFFYANLSVVNPRNPPLGYGPGRFG